MPLSSLPTQFSRPRLTENIQVRNPAARRKTCLDQYKANKAANTNGGLKWLQKRGGYYSQCVKKLKGAA
jgi:hypothetical protein